MASNELTPEQQRDQWIALAQRWESIANDWRAAHDKRGEIIETWEGTFKIMCVNVFGAALAGFLIGLLV